MNLFRLFTKNRSAAGPDLSQMAATEFHEFESAAFVLRRNSPLKLEFSVHLSGMRTQNGRKSVVLTVIDHGLQIECVIDATESDAIVDFGNLLIVPPHLRRQGIASTVLLACIQTFQHAAFGQLLDLQRFRLRGYFIKRGADFARATCFGVLPKNEAPALMDLQKLKRSAQGLQMTHPPKHKDAS